MDLSHEVLDEVRVPERDLSLVGDREKLIALQTVGSWFGEKCMWFHSKIVLSVSGIILVRQGGHE